ncbi:MAG: hypothetical protein ACI4UX_02720, partial [Clostridia bacterium]
PTIGTRVKCNLRVAFLYKVERWDSKRNVPSLGWFKASLDAGKNSPVDYFCDASASGPTIGTRVKCNLRVAFLYKAERWDSKRRLNSPYAKA